MLNNDGNVHMFCLKQRWKDKGITNDVDNIDDNISLI